MPTVFTHAAVPLAIGLGLGRKAIPRPLLMGGALAAVIPDLDVIGFKLGIPYSAAMGHRGFSHSIVFAVGVALLGTAAFRKPKGPSLQAFTFLFLSILSHGLLDTLTTGGKGIALLWPFSAHRFFAPYQVILVSPLSPSRLFSARGAAVLLSEAAWVWLPAIALGAVLCFSRRLMRRPLDLDDDPAP